MLYPKSHVNSNDILTLFVIRNNVRLGVQTTWDLGYNVRPPNQFVPQVSYCVPHVSLFRSSFPLLRYCKKKVNRFRFSVGARKQFKKRYAAARKQGLLRARGKNRNSRMYTKSHLHREIVTTVIRKKLRLSPQHRTAVTRWRCSMGRCYEVQREYSDP